MPNLASPETARSHPHTHMNGTTSQEECQPVRLTLGLVINQLALTNWRKLSNGKESEGRKTAHIPGVETRPEYG